jgi:hypothetical protein
MLRLKENLIVFTRVSSSLPAFLGGSRVIPWDTTNFPPILAAQISPPPGRRGRRLPPVFEFFHSFPATGEEGGGAMLEENSQIEECMNPFMMESLLDRLDLSEMMVEP